MKKHLVKLGLAAAAIVLVPVSAMAVTQTITANISFDTPLTITPGNNIRFGTVSAGVADVYTIDTAGNVTNPGSGQELYGTQGAGDVSIAGSTTQTINISVGTYTANGGVTPSAATCAYGAGPAGPCSLTGQTAPGAGTTLLLGVTATVDGTQAAGSSAAPTFVLTVVYG
jgi:hypothetical protein